MWSEVIFVTGSTDRPTSTKYTNKFRGSGTAKAGQSPTSCRRSGRCGLGPRVEARFSSLGRLGHCEGRLVRLSPPLAQGFRKI
jgi:hypothetical protein